MSMSRLVVSIPSPSGDGKYYGRYPNGDGPPYSYPLLDVNNAGSYMTLLGSFTPPPGFVYGQGAIAGVNGSTLYLNTQYQNSGNNYAGIGSFQMPTLQGAPAYDGSNATASSTGAVLPTTQVDTNGVPLLNFGEANQAGTWFTGGIVYNGKVYVSGGIFYDANGVQSGWLTQVDAALDNTSWGAVNGATYNGTVLVPHNAGTPPNGLRWLSAPMGILPSEWAAALGAPCFIAGGPGFSIAGSISQGFTLQLFDPAAYNAAGGNVPVNELLGYTASTQSLAGRSFAGPFPSNQPSYPSYSVNAVPKAGDAGAILSSPFWTFVGTGSMTAYSQGSTNLGTLTIDTVISGKITLGMGIPDPTKSGAFGTLGIQAFLNGATGGVGQYTVRNNNLATFASGSTIQGVAVSAPSGNYWLIFDSGERRVASIAAGGTALSFSPLTLDCATTNVQIAPAGDNLWNEYDGRIGGGFFWPGTRTFVFVSTHQYGFAAIRGSDPCDPGGAASNSNETPIAPDTTIYRRFQLTAYDALASLKPVLLGQQQPYAPSPSSVSEFPDSAGVAAPQGTCFNIGMGSFQFVESCVYGQNILLGAVPSGRGDGSYNICVWQLSAPPS